MKNKTVRVIVLLTVLILYAGSVLSAMGCGKKEPLEETLSDPGEVPGNDFLEEPTEAAGGGEIDLEKPAAINPDTVGQMTYFPNGDGALAALSGSNLFTLYFENPEVSLNAGFITFYDAGTSAIYESIDVSNVGRCRVYPIDEAGKMLTGWSDGTMIEINLSYPFMPGGSYYVLMDEGCFTDGVHISQEQNNASFIKFSVKDYGVDRLNGFAQTYAQGARAVIQVLIGGDAAYAQIAGYDGEYLSFSQPSFDTTGELTVTFLKEGTPSFRIEYFDSQGTMIDSMTFAVNVIGSNAKVNVS